MEGMEGLEGMEGWKLSWGKIKIFRRSKIKPSTLHTRHGVLEEHCAEQNRENGHPTMLGGCWTLVNRILLFQSEGGSLLPRQGSAMHQSAPLLKSG